MSEQWATVELMGHATTAGRIVMENGLLRVDVPDGETFRTEYYGMGAIYSVKIVSEEISRAFVKPVISAYEYDVPIVTREQHQRRVGDLERQLYAARNEADELKRRLTTVNGLPAPLDDGLGANGEEIPFDNDDEDDEEE